METSPIENLARYLTSRNHYSLENRRVKHTAFLPRDDSLQTSVFIINGLTEEEIWEIGEKVVHPSGRYLHGRGDVTRTAVESQGLHVDIDNNPSRHANIAGWPDDRLRRKEIAVELAENAVLVLR